MARASPPSSQSPSAAPPPFNRYTTPSPPLTVILTFVILIFFFVIFFSIYFCRCFFQNLFNACLQRNNPPPPPPVDPVKPALGLDLEIVKSFPTFDYSSVKGYRREKYGLECAICLIEFVDVDVLRMLTPCCHVFHQECIDLWLESHKTCPVCRRELDLVESPTKPCPLMRDIQEDDTEDSFVITINDDHGDGTIDSWKIVRQKSGGSKEKSTVEKFSKCHSTGHSIVIGSKSSRKDEDIEIGNISGKKEKGIAIENSSCKKEKDIVIENDLSQKEEDRYTLRIPEHVKSHIIKAHHNATRSCTQFGDLKSRSNKESVVLAEICGGDDQDVNKV